jgi:hypothetical protein
MHNNQQIGHLLEEIETVPAFQFWYGSDILARCVQARDPRITIALALRHQGLGNKAAGSAHAIRQTIKSIESADLPTLWRLLESAPTDPLRTPDAPSADPLWAAANILGEIGGATVLYTIHRRIRTNKPAIILARLVAHVVLRYLSISGAPRPTITMFNVVTREERREPLAPESAFHDEYERILNDRRTANAYFGLVRDDVLADLYTYIAHLAARNIDFLLTSGNGIPTSDPMILTLQMAQLTEPQEGAPDWRSWLEEYLPRLETFRDKEHLLQAVNILRRPSFWRDLVIAKRRTWTEFDNTTEFWVERRLRDGPWTLVVELAYPGHPYPYRGIVHIARGHPLHGRSQHALVHAAESLIAAGVLTHEDVECVLALDEAGLDPHTGEWKFGFHAGGFYEDIDWAVQNTQELAGQLRLVSARVRL